MKVQCPRKGLLLACQLASVALPSTNNRSLRPILANLKAVADPDRLTIMATDLEIGIRIGLPGPEIDEAGEAILPAVRLTTILQESTDERLNILADESKCEVRGLSCRFEMPTESPGDFPDVTEFDATVYHEMEAGTLRDMVRRVLFAAAPEEQARHQAINGVLWELSDESLKLVATDSKRLAVCDGPVLAVVGGHAPKGPPVVPIKAMQLLERTLALPDAAEPVRICFRQNEVLFQMAGTVIVSRLKEGKYPAWQGLLPKNVSAVVTLPVDKFFAAVRQAAIMTEKDSRKVTFHFEAGQLTLRAQTTSAATSTVKMAVMYGGPDLKISFDATYLADMLRMVDPKSDVNLELVTPEKPALFKQGDHYLYLVCPLD